MAREVDTRRPPASQKQESSSPKLDPKLALSLILFVFGGGLLALYYADVGYFPEVSWQDALTYLALMAIIGGSLVVAYCFLLFMPGAIWSEYLVQDRQLRAVLTMNERPEDPCVWSIGKRILLPFGLFMTFCHFLLFLQAEAGSQAFLPMGAAASLTAGTTLMWRDLRTALAQLRTAPGTVATGSPLSEIGLVAAFHGPLLALFVVKIIKVATASRIELPGAPILWIAALLPLAGLGVLLVKNPGGNGAHENRAKSLLCRAVLAFVSAALLSLAALWFFYRLYKGGSGSGDAPWPLLLLCTLVVILTNLAVSVVFEQSRRRAILASFLAAVLLLGAGQLIGDRRDGLPVKIMERFGFGGKTATLVLTEKGGRLLRSQGVPVSFEKTSPQAPPATGSQPPDKSNGPAVVPGTPAADQENLPLATATGVEILSRLGSHFLLRLDGRTIAVPKSEVVSWSVAQ